jgi:hypothetical protein
MDYAMSKFIGDEYYEFDTVKTENELKKYLLTLRYDRSLTHKEAKSGWDYINNDYIDFYNIDSFYNTCNYNECLELLINDYEFRVFRNKKQIYEYFWIDIWKPFIEKLKADEIYEQ